MADFAEILELYYGNYPGQRAARLLRVSDGTVSNWKLGKIEAPAYAYRRLLDAVPNRLKEIEKTADRLRRQAEMWEAGKINNCYTARLLLERSEDLRVLKGLVGITPAREEEPRLTQRSSDTALRKRATSSQAPLSSTGLRPPTAIPQAADTNSPSALLHQDGTSACTPQSSVQDGPPISQSQAQPMRVSPPLRGNAAKPRLLPARRSP